MNLCQFHSHFKILFQDFVMNHILFLVVESWNQFFNFPNHYLLRSKWIIIVEVMQFLRILKINFQEKKKEYSPNQKIPQASPTGIYQQEEVYSLPIHKDCLHTFMQCILMVAKRIKIHPSCIYCWHSISRRNHRNSSTSSFFNHQEHVNVCE